MPKPVAVTAGEHRANVLTSDFMPFELTCLDKAFDDEPIFVLRARDDSAPAMVREWARRQEKLGSKSSKIDQARAVANAMETWQISNGSKLAD